VAICNGSTSIGTAVNLGLAGSELGSMMGVLRGGPFNWIRVDRDHGGSNTWVQIGSTTPPAPGKTARLSILSYAQSKLSKSLPAWGRHSACYSLITLFYLTFDITHFTARGRLLFTFQPSRYLRFSAGGLSVSYAASIKLLALWGLDGLVLP
jgi:hypothetical protein